MTLTVAIAGRPNVGKSTLFNKLVGRQMAIVDNTPGVTRDFQIAPARLSDLTFNVMDTAGLEEAAAETIPGRMRQQTDLALERADVVLFMIDGRAGVTEMDRHFAELLRRQSLPVILCVNKCEGRDGAERMMEAYELGFADPLAISAEHAIGIGALYDVLKSFIVELDDDTTDDADNTSIENDVSTDEAFDPDADEEEDTRPIHMAIVGRPNVGKSTLFNALVGEDRSMVGEEAGITRDAVSVPWNYAGRDYRLVDTAGMRRKSKVTEKIEKLSLDDTFRAIRLSHVVVLVVEGNAILDKQDLQIARMVADEGRGLIVCVNKWDQVEDKNEALLELRHKIEHSIPQCKGLRFVTTAALYGKNMDKLMIAVKDTYDIWNRRVSTGKLNRWLEGMMSSHLPPLANGRPNKIKYITQAKARPPTFGLWVSRPDDLPDSYRRYLVNGLRNDFDIPGVPIRLLVKASKNPYIK